MSIRPTAANLNVAFPILCNRLTYGSDMRHLVGYALEVLLRDLVRYGAREIALAPETGEEVEEFALYLCRRCAEEAR